MLQRPKFRRWLTADEARAFVQTIRTSVTLINDPPPQHHAVRDPDDSYLLTLARSAKADYLISGDADLTSLDNPRPPVITPADFLASLNADG